MIIRLPRPIEDFILRHPLLISLLIAAILVLTTGYFWRAYNGVNQMQTEMERNERQLMAISELQAASVQFRERLDLSFELARARLQFLAGLSTSESRVMRVEFNHRARELIRENNLFESIGFSDVNLNQKMIFPEKNQPDSLEARLTGIDAHREFLASGIIAPDKSILSALTRLPDGSTGFFLDIPVYSKSGLIGFITSYIRLAPFIQEALGILGRNYGVRITEAEEEFYSNLPSGKKSPSFTRQIIFSPDGQTHWTLELSLSDKSLSPARITDTYDIFILMTGFAVAAFVSLLVYRLVSLVKRSREQESEKSQLLSRVQRSERELFSFIDSANVILLVVDEQRAVTLCNYTLQKYTGYSPEELKNKNWWKHFRIPPDQTAIIEKVFAGRKSVDNLETQIITASGEKRYIIWNIGPTTTDQGFRFVCVGRDITERKVNAAALRLTEQRFQILFEEMKEGVIATDTDGNITQINLAARDILRLPKGPIEGRPVGDIFTHMIREDGTPLGIKFFAPHISLLERRSLYGFVAGLKHSEKDTTWIYGSSGVLNLDSQFMGIIVTFSDITPIKLSEAALNHSRESLRQIITNMQNGVLLCDPLDRVEVSNPQFARMWNLSEEWLSSHPPFGQVVEKIVEASTQKSVVAGKLKATTKNLLPEQFELTINDTFFVEFFTIRLSDNHRLWTFRDISQSRVLEHQLRQAQKMESVGQLAGGLAHDFNNILTVVNGYLALALEQTDPADKRYVQLGRTREALNRAVGITRKLLTFSRGDIFRKETLCLDTIIRNSVDLLSRSVPGNIKIELELSSGDKKIFADNGAMDQILVNLCLNAVDALPRGGVIHISTRFFSILSEDLLSKLPRVESSGYIQWRVKDNGTGIPPEIMARIFEPFYTTKQNKSGTGLGLAMVYGICRSHGGFVDVESVEGQGTSFTIYLPVTLEKAYEETSVLSSGLHDFHQLNDKVVLLVDDEEMVLEMVSDLLEDKRMLVYKASSGSKALEIFRESMDKIDLVITDMVMPGMSGLDLIDQIKALNPHVDFMVTSGYTIKEQQEELDRRGIDSFLVKPYEPSHLFKMLHDLFSKKAKDKNPSTSK